MGKNDSGATERQKSGRKIAEASAGSLRHSTYRRSCHGMGVYEWVDGRSCQRESYDNILTEGQLKTGYKRKYAMEEKKEEMVRGC